MTPRSPSPPLIKGIDGIVIKHRNEVNYSTLNGKRTFGNMAKYVKQAKMLKKRKFEETRQSKRNQINENRWGIGWRRWWTQKKT